MTGKRLVGLALVLVSGAISILWGLSIGKNAHWVDFRAVYYGTRCLLEHRNPYNVSQLDQVYTAEKGAPPNETPLAHQAVTLYVNVPTLFVVLAPLAVLPWGLANLLWLSITAAVLVLASILMWDLGTRYAPAVALLLTCIFLANCESIFSTGNTAGIVVGLCVVAVWCFVQQRFVLAGVLCLALSLAMKPHDGGLVWLYFLLAGAPYRKRALQTLLVTVVLGLASFVWVSSTAPHWIHDWRANLATISQPGGINEPGPNAVNGHAPAMVVDLQAAVSVFRDDPRIYNPFSYVVCGSLLLVWSVRTHKLRNSQSRVWFALAAVTALTMLITYHRPWDAKLLLITIPACAILWTEGGVIAWLALLINAAAIVFTGDIPLAALVIIADKMHIGTADLTGKILTLLVTRPASLILFAMAVFYLWMYLRRADDKIAFTTPHQTSRVQE